MTRTNAREIVLQLVYEMNFREDDPISIAKAHMDSEYFDTLKTESDAYVDTPDPKQSAYIESTLCGIEQKRTELEEYIRRYSVGWDIARISKIALSIMLLAMYEALYVDDVPVSSAINEAVELTRKYEDESAVAFVNGILGSFAREVVKA